MANTYNVPVKPNANDADDTSERSRPICETDNPTDRSDDGSRRTPTVQVKPSSYPMPIFVHDREIGCSKRIRQKPNLDLKRMLREYLLVEKTYSVKPLDKLFCSEWLNSRQVIFGTKCNRLMLLDTNTEIVIELQNLRSSSATHQLHDQPCGIHALAINPSRTRLATGARNPNDSAVFELPSLNPICVGETGHENWIGDIKWVDDKRYVSGGRDGKLIMWDVDEKYKFDYVTNGHIRGKRNEEVPEYYSMNCVREVRQRSQGVRGMSFQSTSKTLTSLTAWARLQLWDVELFKILLERTLEEDRESACIATCDNLTAVGSQPYVTIVDSRSLKSVKTLQALNNTAGVRSLSFNENLLTVGTDMACVLFLDIRNYRYIGFNPELQSATEQEISFGPSCLKCSPGWLSTKLPDFKPDFNPAVFTHCYDPSGLRLFTGGGPLQANGTKGAYAALWA